MVKKTKLESLTFSDLKNRLIGLEKSKKYNENLKITRPHPELSDKEYEFRKSVVRDNERTKREWEATHKKK
jgi:hypothetical protein